MSSILSNLLNTSTKMVMRCSPTVGLPQLNVFPDISSSSVSWTAVRFRFHADKVAKGLKIHRHGYDELIFKKGLLPRNIYPDRALPIPDYKPKNAWNEKRALFGQNDYIDILGPSDSITGLPLVKPSQLLYHVPRWLRGFQGNEYQMLLKKKRFLETKGFNISSPTKWVDMNKRIIHQYKYLNRKTQSYFWKKA